ncbi:MAG: hypothetical protein KDK04_03075 [Candidatus Competibacteraceae bacterium]|nr:hypothetical protein [Caldilineaceae bacterium]MCB1810694.1 hypothetical protein [Candidatus Competibacteraceae bacterium]
MILNPTLPNRSLAVLQQSLRLASHVGIKTYNRTFRRMDAALYLAQIVVRVQGQASREYEPEIAQVNEAISAELKRLEDHLRTTGQWIKNKLKSQSSAVQGVGYTDASTVELTVRTPKGRHYAQLLTQLEGIAQQLDQAWYEGVISDVEQIQKNHALWRASLRACQVIERLARGLAARVRDDRSPSQPYADMLKKRTGMGPLLDTDQAAPEGALQDDATEMTAQEAAALADTEQLAAALSEENALDSASAEAPKRDRQTKKQTPSEAADRSEQDTSAAPPAPLSSEAAQATIQSLDPASEDQPRGRLRSILSGS